MKNSIIKYFIYARKSTEDKERQILSLESQIEAMKQMIDRENLKIIKIFKESKSAKEPDKRPVFTEMVVRIKCGEANGIICWKLDRLARNPDEAGKIIGMLQREEIKHIKTYEKDYYPADNSVISFVEFGIANQFSRDLSKNVKRGIDKKAQMGWRPTLAPLGYLNSKTKLKGEQDIFIDQERFDVVKQLFQLMITGHYTVPKLFEISNEKLKLTMPATKARPQRKLHLSQLYKILTNPFYYGWYEWPKDSGSWIKGNHKSMITEAEYDHIQTLLGGKAKPRPKTRRFAFTGIMRCGFCGAAITAEEKFKKSKSGKMLHYVYYHCTKKINPDCFEKSIEVNDFYRQVDAILEKITTPEKFKDWAIRFLHEIHKEESKTGELILENKQKAIQFITQQLDSLLIKYASPENMDNQLISAQDYQTLKSRLMKEKDALENQLDKETNKNDWLELSKRSFNFTCYARIWFAKGDMEAKRSVFACLGSNHILELQKVALTLRKEYQIISNRLPMAKQELKRLESLNIGSLNWNLKAITAEFPVLSG